MKKWLILAVVVAVGIIGSGVYLQTRPGKFDDFAKCIARTKKDFLGILKRNCRTWNVQPQMGKGELKYA